MSDLNRAGFYGMWDWGDRSTRMLAKEAGALSGLRREGAIEVAPQPADNSAWRTVGATPSGRALLAQWNEQYGTVKA